MAPKQKVNSNNEYYNYHKLRNFERDHFFSNKRLIKNTLKSHREKSQKDNLYKRRNLRGQSRR